MYGFSVGKIVICKILTLCHLTELIVKTIYEYHLKIKNMNKKYLNTIKF